jgi:hypothetical protein
LRRSSAQSTPALSTAFTGDLAADLARTFDFLSMLPSGLPLIVPLMPPSIWISILA